MSEKIKITVWVATDRVGSKTERQVTFDREDWDEWDEHERDAAVFEEIQNRSMYEWGYRE